MKKRRKTVAKRRRKIELDIPWIETVRPRKRMIELDIPWIETIEPRTKKTKPRAITVAKTEEIKPTRIVRAWPIRKKKKPSLALMLMMTIIMTGLISSVTIAHQLGVINQLKRDLNTNATLIENLTAQATTLQATIKDENNKMIQTRAEVLRLDTYLSYVKAYWPRLYLQDIINSDIVEWGVQEALNNPKYAPTVRKIWENYATNEKFFRSAEVVESIYKFVTQNVEYAHDNEEYNKEEVYVPVDWMLKQIQDNTKVKGDCEDMSLLIITLISRASLDDPSLEIENIVVKEGVVRLPIELSIFGVKTIKGLVPLWFSWKYGFFGHAWVSLQLPHPTTTGEVIDVALEPTHYLGDQNVPWSSWVENSPEAKWLHEQGWVFESPIPEIEHLFVPYPLNGYSEGHKWIEFDIWRSYGAFSISGIRLSYRFPRSNQRPGSMLRGDPEYGFFKVLFNIHGTYNPCDLPNWQSYYHG